MTAAVAATNRIHIKDHNASKPYSWDWAAFLAGDTIATTDVLPSVPAGLTLGTPTHTATTVTVTVSGGTLGAQYDVTCRITTAAGLVEDCTKTFIIRAR